MQSPELIHGKIKGAVDYKIYCDESCHLQHDGSNVMVLGALRCDASQVERIVREIKALRIAHGYQTELKWTKLLAKQWPFYKALLDLLLTEPALNFKATVVLNKNLLNHDQYNSGSHGTFYYKMAYYSLRDFLIPSNSYRIYLDYMDTLGATKARELSNVLHNQMRGAVHVDVQIIRSHESQLIQLCDLLIGAVAYSNRDDLERTGTVKVAIVDYLQQQICRKLNVGTPPWEEKFNIFMFSPRSNAC
ncbi:DUF3800 domain-containing protein [Deefgea salmonis]|uniref:DUF3800 domain-containing protein n=1 Tax=Deefgea salmonis TaxID=2875502 RepID=A0ABS8BJB3_9NEIS|nr:DUF3800 domain-containing protein [Deefgea salmonis]MCB5195704.1 DUF3800 domain-containing protein [Deefgea salmonis]